MKAPASKKTRDGNKSRGRAIYAEAKVPRGNEKSYKTGKHDKY